jgi:autotransporter-associated beta strand protein
MWFDGASTAGSATITNSVGAGLGFHDTSTAGSATITNYSTLNFNNSSTASGANIHNVAYLNFNDSASAGSAAITNTGTLEFKDVATAANAQITTTGTTNFRNTSSAGNATLTVSGNYNSYVNFYNTSTAGSATINVDIGNLNFRDTTTAGNATIVNNGGLITWNSATLGNATITNNRGLYLEDSSSAGNATITNNAWIYFYYSSTAGTATIVNNHSLNFWGDSSAGSAHITNATTGTLEIVNGGTLANATVVNTSQMSFWGGNPGDVPTAGNATITNYASGTIEFRDNGTAGSATVTNAGTIIFSNSSTAGNASITNNNQLQFYASTTAGSAVIVNRGNVLFDGNSTPGNAQLINNAPGAVFDLSMTTGPNGNVTISAGSIAGGGTFYLGEKELTVGGNNLSTTVTGVIADGGSWPATGGSLVKTGTGTLTLSGINTYTGATTVSGGALVVNGSIAASSGVTVNNGGILGGGGIVGSTTVNAGGTLAAGNGSANSSLNVAGSLALQSGAAYMVQINPATSSSVNVSGTATLGGSTLRAVYANGSYVAKQYTILTAGSVNGTFGSFVETNLPSNFHTTLSYDATHAYLNLILNFIAPPGSGLSGNQQNVGNAIINAFNANGGISLVYSGLTASGLTQASGETAAGSQQTTFQAMGQFTGLLTDPFSTGRETGASTPPAYADSTPTGAARDAFAMLPAARIFEPRWNVWAAGFGGSQTTDGNTAQGSNSATSRLFGTAAGAAYWFSPQTLAGFALGGGGTSFSVTGGGTGRSDLFQAGAYLRHSNGPSYISAALAYGWQDVTTDRTVTLAGVDRLRAEFNANAWSGRLEGGYRFVAPWIGGIGVTPYAAGQFTTFDLPAYAESVVSGGGAFALSYAAKSVTDTRSELGLRADKSFAMANAILTLRGRAAWAHDSNPDHSVAAAFQALPGASFVVNGARAASDSALTTASAEMKWLNGWSAAATFEGEFSNATRSYAGKGSVRYAW